MAKTSKTAVDRLIIIIFILLVSSFFFFKPVKGRKMMLNISGYVMHYFCGVLLYLVTIFRGVLHYRNLSGLIGGHS